MVLFAQRICKRFAVPVACLIQDISCQTVVGSCGSKSDFELFIQLIRSLSTDRQQWIKAAEEYGSAKFSDENNTVDTQKQRLTVFKSAHDADKLDGLGGAHIEFFDVLQGRAHMKDPKAAG